MNILDSHLYVSDLEKAAAQTDLSALKGRTVMITGGMGLIGSAVADLLLTADSLFGLNLQVLIGERSDEVFCQKYSSRGNIRFIRYDALLPFAWDFTPDYIIHCAGIASPELYMNAPVETMLTNMTGILNILRYAQTVPVRRILYISSSEVYGEKTSPDPFIEGQYGTVDIDSIRSSYPVAKRSAEMLCRAYTAEYGIDAVTVRPGHIFGPTAGRNDRRVSSDFAYRAAMGQDLVLKSSGLQKRSYCYTADAALQILTVLLSGKKGEAYNIGSEKAMTIRDMAEIYAKTGGVRLKAADPTDAEKSAFNPMLNSSLDIGKICSIGYREAIGAEAGLAHTVMILREAAGI